MSFWYTPAKQRLATGLLNLDTADLRLLAVMSNTTADTDQDAATISAITTLDEYDGATYARIDLGDPVVTQDDVNNRSEIDVADFSWPTLGAGTRQCVGFVVFEHVTADTDSRPIAFIDQPAGTNGFPFNGNGGAVNVTVNAEGLLQVA